REIDAAERLPASLTRFALALRGARVRRSALLLRHPAAALLLEGMLQGGIRRPMGALTVAVLLRRAVVGLPPRALRLRRGPLERGRQVGRRRLALRSLALPLGHDSSLRLCFIAGKSRAGGMRRRPWARRAATARPRGSAASFSGDCTKGARR